jgi:hypothetical protein
MNLPRWSRRLRIEMLEGRCVLSVAPADLLAPRAADIVSVALTVTQKQGEEEALATPCVADAAAPPDSAVRVPEVEQAATPVLAGRVGVLDVLFTAGSDVPNGTWSLEQE